MQRLAAAAICSRSFNGNKHHCLGACLSFAGEVMRCKRYLADQILVAPKQTERSMAGRVILINNVCFASKHIVAGGYGTRA